jgi:UDP:flavonoid glycosyltransferase YjiC (YdhE family)
VRVLLAWDWGCGYGHLGNLRAAALGLRAAGHSCVLAACYPAEAKRVFEEGLVEAIVQAPYPQIPRAAPGRAISFSSLLLSAGFDSPTGLGQRIASWAAAMDGFDHVVTDFSPVALIAARLLGLPRTDVGMGFSAPPIERPFPVFDVWRQYRVEQDVLGSLDHLALLGLNEALETVGAAPYERLQDIYAGCQRALLTYPEMDHYGPRAGNPAQYLGVPLLGRGAQGLWSSHTRPRVLAYLRPHPRLDDALAALSASRASVVLHAAEMEPDYLVPYLRPGFVVSHEPIDLPWHAQTCDAWLSYAPHGTSCEMMLAGKPGIALPDTLERQLVGMRLSAIGGTVVAPVDGAFDVSEALERALGDQRLRWAAELFRDRHRGEGREGIAERLAEIVLGAS